MLKNASMKLWVLSYKREVIQISKQRYVDTKFWDDNYIVNRDPIEKLLYLYFLTNTLTNIIGIYEISIRRIAFDTGIDKDMVIKILSRFEEDKKIKYKDGYIAIRKFTKHQANNPKINKGMEELLKEVPMELVEWVEIDFNRLEITLDSLYIGLDRTSKDLNYSNININSNSNNNTNRGDNSTDDIKQVFNYWKEIMNHPKAILSNDRKDKIKARLKEGVTVDDCKKAIYNCSQSAYHMGDNDRKKRYDSIDLIFRKIDKLEWFINMNDTTCKAKKYGIV
jgi:hypothetical protein